MLGLRPAGGSWGVGIGSEPRDPAVGLASEPPSSALLLLPGSGTQVFPGSSGPLLSCLRALSVGPFSSPASVGPQARLSLAHAPHPLTGWVKQCCPGVLVASSLLSFPGPQGAWPAVIGAVAVGGQREASVPCQGGSPTGLEDRIWSMSSGLGQRQEPRSFISLSDKCLGPLPGL